jgi:hypothetical protein
MSEIREKAANILKEVPKGEPGIRSDKQPAEFKRFTGYTHQQMLDSWRANMNGPKLLTACGGYASYVAGRLGITGIESFFELEKSLNAAGKAHAWVPASAGAKPQVGDILRHTAFHVDVAAGWDGGKLIRVAAGQSYHPRPTKSVENEFDALKWVTGKADYNPANLQGWLDLDLYFGAAPAPGPTTGWLNGWWKVWDGNTYYYFFGPNGAVSYIKTPPTNTGAGPIHPNNRGRYTLQGSQLVITWNLLPGSTAQARETFYNASEGCRQMNANSNLYSPLVATRLG